MVNNAAAVAAFFLFGQQVHWPTEGKTSAEGGKILPRQNDAVGSLLCWVEIFLTTHALLFPGVGQYLR